MPNHTEYRAFTKPYDKQVNKLITLAGILPLEPADRVQSGMVEVKALWDTGATMSCIKPLLRDKLNLRMIKTGSPMPIAGIGGLVKANFTLLTIFLAHNLIIECCPLYVVDFPGNTDILIGTNIIMLGDFTVCNADGKTSFSFAIPPFPDRIDLTDKAAAANRRNVV